MPAYGRGGAGNIEAASSVLPPSTSTQPQPTTTTTSQTAAVPTSTADLEKSLTEAEAHLSSHHALASYAGTAHPALHSQEYAHMGRGGAGNYYSPRELQMKGEFAGAGTSHVLGDGTPVPKGEVGGAAAEKDVSGGGGGGAYRGRGGAGNYSFGGVSEGEERASRRRIEEMERKERGVREEVLRGVEEGLARPEKAFLSAKEEEV